MRISTEHQSHELARYIARPGFRSPMERQSVRSQTHIESRRYSALEHYPARDVVRFKRGTRRKRFSYNGGSTRGGPGPRTKRELIYVKEGARRGTNQTHGNRFIVLSTGEVGGRSSSPPDTHTPRGASHCVEAGRSSRCQSDRSSLFRRGSPSYTEHARARR
jgi:hypothetical protein